MKNDEVVLFGTINRISNKNVHSKWFYVSHFLRRLYPSKKWENYVKYVSILGPTYGLVIITLASSTWERNNITHYFITENKINYLKFGRIRSTERSPSFFVNPIRLIRHKWLINSKRSSTRSVTRLWSTRSIQRDIKVISFLSSFISYPFVWKTVLYIYTKKEIFT